MTPSKEVEAATGEAPARVDSVQLLNEKRQALNAARERYATAKAMRDEIAMSDETRLIEALKELIPILETDAQVVLEATGQKAATERLLGIKRANGSHRTELYKCRARVSELAEELGKVAALEESWQRKCEADQMEVNCLTDRFDLPPVKLEVVPEPPRIEVPRPWQYKVVRPSFEQCEHALRARRDYAEIAGSVGYAIIQKAGLKPFRSLTEREREVLTDREEERKPDPILVAAATEAQALGALRVAGHVHRG